MKKFKQTLMVAGLLGYGILANSLVLASILDNGSFESPMIAPNTHQLGTPTSWSWTDSVGFIFNGTVFNSVTGSYWPSPQDGSQFINIANVSSYSLLQSFSVTYMGRYQLSWYDNAHQFGSTSPYSVSVIDGEQRNIFSISLDAAHGGVWRKRMFLLDLAPGTYTLSFTAQGHTGGYDTLLDNISLTATENNDCAYNLEGDLNDDCKVNLSDLVVMAKNWLVDCRENPENIACVYK